MIKSKINNTREINHNSQKIIRQEEESQHLEVIRIKVVNKKGLHRKRRTK